MCFEKTTNMYWQGLSDRCRTAKSKGEGVEMTEAMQGLSFDLDFQGASFKAVSGSGYGGILGESAASTMGRELMDYIKRSREIPYSNLCKISVRWRRGRGCMHCPAPRRKCYFLFRTTTFSFRQRVGSNANPTTTRLDLVGRITSDTPEQFFDATQGKNGLYENGPTALTLSSVDLSWTENSLDADDSTVGAATDTTTASTRS